jgi:glycosyltransferase involved in cell wall biosynthesis
VGHLVVRNECDRYLPRVLAWLSQITDAIHVYDDHSTDGTPIVCEAFGAIVTRRGEAIPSFYEDEGRYRAAAWHAMEQALAPDHDTWVLVIDADEFLVARTAKGIGLAVAADIAEAETAGATAIRVPVAEVWALHDGAALVRVDGLWNKIDGIRLVRYQAGGEFADRREACGSAPAYAATLGKSTRLQLLHFGYAGPADRAARLERYSRGTGHNPRHVASIATPPTLMPWMGELPDALTERP